ncbi:MAG: type II secretion system protein [Pseudomonadota bacterium]
MTSVARKVDAVKKVYGFSYVELVFVIAILALLAAVATPYLEKNIQRKKELELKQNLREIRIAIDEYKAASDQGKVKKSIGDSGYPHHLEDLVIGVEDITDPQKKKLRFLRRLPADPMYPKNQHLSSNDEINPADTWGKRSYISDAENPREGDDVYDIYSLSSDVGLNGVSYAQW